MCEASSGQRAAGSGGRVGDVCVGQRWEVAAWACECVVDRRERHKGWMRG